MKRVWYFLLRQGKTCVKTGFSDDTFSCRLKLIEDIYDPSNYDPHNLLFSNKNKNIIGKFKDE